MGAEREKLVQTIVELRGQGEAYAAIGSRVGLSEEAVRGIWRRSQNRTENGTVAAIPEQPRGMERCVQIDGDVGYIATGPVAVETPNFEELLRHFGFDPELFEILEPVNVRTWDAAVGDGKVRRMWYHRANIRRRRAGLYLSDVNELIEFVRSKPQARRPRAATPGGEAFIFAPSDLQLGASDGDGAKGTVARFKAALNAAQFRIDDLRRLGREIDDVHLIHLADGVEGTAGHYAMQTYNVEMGRRDQVKVLRELLWEAADAFAKDVTNVHVSGVAGNHPENRLNGKAFTSFGDNDDLAVLDQIQMIAEATGRDRMRFAIPKDELELVIDACGTKIGVAHGHQMRNGSTPETRVKKWWEDQMLGRLPIGEADILITGHLHHLIVKEMNGRWWIQCPTLTSRSDWAVSTMGAPGCPGILTFTTSNGKWRDLQVL